jgi:hypothetical protein
MDLPSSVFPILEFPTIKRRCLFLFFHFPRSIKFNRETAIATSTRSYRDERLETSLEFLVDPSRNSRTFDLSHWFTFFLLFESTFVVSFAYTF